MLLFCLRHCRYCIHAFELQCFRVLPPAVYLSWCVNSYQSVHGNCGTRGSACHSRLNTFTLVKAVFEALIPSAPASGEPAGKAKRPRTSSSATLVVRQTRRNKSVLLFQLRSGHFFITCKAMVFLSICFCYAITP